jgi:hypothetical protein
MTATNGLLSTLRTYRGSMPATATYAKRWWLWIPTPGMPCDGFILLGQVAERSYQFDEQTYGVAEVGSVHGFGWRSFAVRKCGAEPGAEDEMYTCSVGPRGVSVCTCKAGRTRHEVCRHRDGLRAAIDAGAMPRKPLQGA